MILNISQYSHNKEPFLKWFARQNPKTDKAIIHKLSEFSASFMLPLVAVYSYYLEEFENKAVEENLAEIIEFYGIKGTK